MSRYLRQVEKQMGLQPKPKQAEPADTAGLGDALAQVIRAQVQQQVQEAVEKQRPAVAEHRQPFTDKPFSDTFPAPPPMAKPVRDLSISLQRGADDKVRSVSIGPVKFTALRDGAGKLIGMRQED